jgi:predicted phage tail protein
MSDLIGHKGGSSEHVHYEAPDSLHSISYARVLDLVSEGEILGLAEGLQSVFLDDTPVQNADGTSNFTGVTIDFRAGTQTQDYIPGFPDVENEVSVNVELKATAPWVHAISDLALSATASRLACRR